MRPARLPDPPGSPPHAPETPAAADLLSALVEAAPAALAVLLPGSDGWRVEMANGLAAQLLHATPGLPVADLVIPDAAVAEIVSACDAIMAGAGAHRLETRCSTGWLEIRLTPGPGPGPSAVLLAATDLSDRRLLERELVSTRDRLALVVQASRDGIWDWDLRNGTIWFSPQWKAQFGYADDELPNTLDSWSTLIFPEDREAGLSLADAYLTGAADGFATVQRFRHRDGHTVLIYSRAVKELDREGQPVRLLGTTTDLTSVRQLEAKLASAERRLVDAIERLNDGFILYDAEDRVVLFNSRLVEFYPEMAAHLRPGRTFEEVLRDVVRSGGIPGARVDDEAWIAERIFRHRNPGDTFERVLADGRIIRIEEFKTPEGGIVSLGVDVTQLRDSERRFRDLIAGSLQGIIIQRGDRALFANDAFARIHDFPNAEAVLACDTLEPLVAPEEYPVLVQLLRSVEAGGPPATINGMAARRQDGKGIWVDVSLRFVRWFDGPAVQATIVDVSERIRAESALRESEPRFRDLVSTVPGMVYQWVERPDGRFGYSYVSPRARDLYGVDPEAVLADWSHLALVEEDVPRWRASIDDAIAKGTDWSFEGRFQLKDGSVRWWRGVSRPLRQPDGTVLFNGIVIDIEEQKRIEAELRYRETMLSYTAGLAGLGSWVWDPQGQSVVFSDELLQIQAPGVGWETLVPVNGGLDWRLGLVHPDDRDYYASHALDVAASQRSYVVEYRIQRPDGQVRHVREVGGPVHDDRGDMVKYIGAIQDITERKQRELELEEARDRLERQAQKMTALAGELAAARDAALQASLAKSRFLAVMSHELRTPMTGVIGMIDLMRGTEIDDRQRRYLHTLRSSADSLLAILNDVLDFSKIEEGQLVLERIPMRLPTILDDVVRLFTPAAERKGLRLVASSPDMELPDLLGDPTRLRQVLMNLVGNAVKFTETGEVTLRLSLAAPPPADSADALWSLRLEVADTGIGIPADALPRLFDAFSQADATTTRRFGGTGLGLAICKRLVEAMGGAIRVDSVPARGSTFAFDLTLPRAAPRPAIPVPVQGPAAASPARILVAEDNQVNRLLIVTMLERMGHRVDAVENGRLAVEVVQRGDHDLVLMDMQMPEMDGATAADHIRALPGPIARIPIVALTADALPEDRLRHIAARRFDDYLTKPIDWPRLGLVIASLTAAARTPPL